MNPILKALVINAKVVFFNLAIFGWKIALILHLNYSQQIWIFIYSFLKILCSKSLLFRSLSLLPFKQIFSTG